MAKRREAGERVEAGFYICLRDGDGAADTFEQTRIIILSLEVLKRISSRDGPMVAFKRIYEEAAVGTLSPKKFTETTADPDDGDFYDAVVTLTAMENGEAEFRSELLDMDGDRELRPKRINVDLSGPFPKTVTIPHPFTGELVYRRGGELEEEGRAAQLEILGVKGEVLTYRVVRGFMPWRYWSEGPARRPERRIRWRPRP